MRKYHLPFFVSVIFGISTLLFLVHTGWTQLAGEKALEIPDCAKCHTAPPADIAADGAGHKKITCRDCHASHRPAVKDNIPKCSQCHLGKTHYELKNCLSCHKNPHTPLIITFANNLSEPCLTCHSKQIEQLRAMVSRHTGLNCSYCHDIHGKLPACTKCHKPHSSAMTGSDCKNCHKAHMPRAVSYTSATPSKDCGSCHTKAYELLMSSSARHKTFACAFCHQEKHRMVPRCQDCHGEPHPENITAKFSSCGECHNTAHDLNNWTSSEQKKTANIKKKS